MCKTLHLDWQKMFVKFLDLIFSDFNGHLDWQEFEEVCKIVGLDLTREEVQKVFSVIDPDELGHIDYTVTFETLFDKFSPTFRLQYSPPKGLSFF